MTDQARQWLLAGIAGVGITTSVVAQTSAPPEKPKPSQKKTEAPKTPETSSGRIVIRSGEDLIIPGNFNGTLELNSVTVNDLIGLIEKVRAEDEQLQTYVIREEAGEVVLPRIVTRKDGLKEMVENLPSIEPKLGVEQLPQGGYVILTRETKAPQEEKTFAAFGLKEYLNRLTNDFKNMDPKEKDAMRERAIAELQKLIEDAFELQGITKEKSASQVSIRIHQSTGVLLATGTPKQLAVIRTTLQALGIPGSVSGSSQDWAPRYVPGGSGGGGMMGGGMGGWSPAPAPVLMPGMSTGALPAVSPSDPSFAPGGFGGGGLPGGRSPNPISSAPARPAAPSKKPGFTTPASPIPSDPMPSDSAVPQLVSPNRP